MKKFVLVILFVLLSSLVATAQEVPKYEISTGFSDLRESQPDKTRDYPGWYASFARNINNWFALEGEYSGHFNRRSRAFIALGPNGPETLSFRDRDSDHLFLIGPKFSYRGWNKVTLYAHALPGLRYNISREIIPTGGPVFTDSTVEHKRASFAIATGGGVDINITKGLAIRPIQADFIHTDHPFAADANDLRLSTGIVFRFGSK